MARQARRQVIRKGFGGAAVKDESLGALKRKRDLLDEFEQTMVMDMNESSAND